MLQLSIVTTCKNRLEHLRQTLPAMLAQADSEVIVVDYGCPQGCGDWVLEHFPQVRVIHVDDDPEFCLARARNAGARQARAEWLAFVDADIVLAGDFAAVVTPLLIPGYHYINDAGTWETYGTCLCRRADFDRIEGYDEVFGRLRGEDEDLYFRLSGIGVSRAHFPDGLLKPISHGDELRGLRGIGEKLAHQRISTLYIQAKADLARLTASPDRMLREKLLAAARRSVMTLDDDDGFRPMAHNLTVDMPLRFPNLDFFGLSLSRKIVYTLAMPVDAPLEAIRARVTAGTGTRARRLP